MSTGLDPAKFAEAVADSSAAAAENLSASITDSVNGTFNPSTATTTTQFVSTPTTTSSQIFTEAQIAAAREQEKSKLYPQIENLKTEVETLRREKEEREAAEAARAAEIAEENRRLAEQEMTARELIEAQRADFAAQLADERREREAAIAMLDMERQYQELQSWKIARIEQERDSIMPELLDMVDGDSPEAIEASITSLKDRTARILDSAQQAMSATRRDMVGTRLTAPAAGPLDTNTGQRTFSPEDIKNMSLSEYQKYRNELLGSGAANNGRGLFG